MGRVSDSCLGAAPSAARKRVDRPAASRLTVDTMLGQATAVLSVLFLLIATLWVLRRNGLASLNFTLAKRMARQKFLHVVERVPLTPNHSLHLVQVQNRLLLIAVSPAGCAQIESFSASLLNAPDSSDLLNVQSPDAQAPSKS